MARTRSWNPIAFVPAQVTSIVSLVYIAVFAVLLWTHLELPEEPHTSTPQAGLNLTQAWLDLDYISDGFHTIDSRRNDEIRAYLLRRIHEILDSNNATSEAVAIIDDLTSNVTFVDTWRKQPWSCHIEGTNILVYIRGEDDEPGDWWNTNTRYEGPGGVLVNAHFDSVASGFGATDDGVGVVTILQLISHYTTEGNQPKHGLVALLNNGEEHGLYGAHTYARHRLSQFPHIFLNLEGAGSGGRATLFRSSDAEVTRFYANSPYPFGTVLSGDAFKRGAIRSGTDYSVFTEDLGLRGLDVAFYEPRANYHTDRDDSRHTSPRSLWHMLSAALATIDGMTAYDGDAFDGSMDRNGKFHLKTGSDAVWFDMLGRAFAVIELHTLFAISVALLVAMPIIFVGLEIALAKNDRWYPFARVHYLHSPDDDDPVRLDGLRGFFRFPIAVSISSAIVIGLAYLVVKMNPEIIYSSEYAVHAMMLTIFFSTSWFLLTGADRIRPTALQRFHILLWLYLLSWIALVFDTVGENNFEIASGYFVVIYHAAIAAAFLVSYIELLALPTKTKYVEHVTGVQRNESEAGSIRQGSRSSRTLWSGSRERNRTGDTDDDEANERTSLLRGGASAADNRSYQSQGAASKRRQTDRATLDDYDDRQFDQAYGDEQAWSSSLPQWTWIIQFLLLAPINIILVGQIALFATTAMHQTSADGNGVLGVYLFVAFLDILLLLPIAPFIHRFNYKIPTFLFAIFLGCLIYNLVAFPFSVDSRLKFYFVQRVDLNTGDNNVTLSGVDGFLQQILNQLPSASGQPERCGRHAEVRRAGTQSCSFSGLLPKAPPTSDIAQDLAPYRNHTAGPKRFKSWLDYNITSHGSSASFSVRGRDVKMCRITFDNAVSSIVVEGAAEDARFAPVGEDGSTQITLVSRTWDKTFHVDVAWDGGQTAKAQAGRVWCYWNDANQWGAIPAFDEARRFSPIWSVPTKLSDGLLEGYKDWQI